MKKKITVLFLALTLLFSGANFNSEPVAAADKKVYWDGIMMVPGQVGKVKIIKPINLWKRTSGGLQFERVLKPGEQYRVYRYDNLYGGQYGLGGGMYVTKMAGYIDYRTPSKAKLAELERIYGSGTTGGSNPTDLSLYPNEKKPILELGNVLNQSIVQIAPGVRQKNYRLSQNSIYQQLFMLEYDGKTSNIGFQTQLSKDKVSGFETTSSQANRVPQNAEYHVVGGVNADYFDSNGNPVDLMMMDGSIVTTPQTPLNELAVLGIKRDGKAVIGAPTVSMSVTVNGQHAYAINSVNRKRLANHLVVYTNKFGTSTKTNELGTEVRVKVESGKLNGNSNLVGTVVDKEIGIGDTTLNENEIVLSGHHKANEYLQSVQVGDRVEIATVMSPSEWNEVEEAVSGRYHLVKKGVLQNINIAGVAPRTAVGVRKDGSVFTVVVDGRKPGYSSGLSLQETAKLMRDLGAYDSITFDGGGSSTLVSRELGDHKVTVQNRPSDGAERSVANSLLFVSKWKTGPLHQILADVQEVELFQGAFYNEIPVAIKGIDQYMNPITVPKADITSPALKKTTEGTYLVTGGAGKHSATANVSGKSTNFTISITNKLDGIRVSTPYIHINYGESLQLQAEGLKSGQVVLNRPQSFNWSATPNVGAIAGNGLFRAGTQPAIGSVKVSYGDKVITVPVVVGEVAPTILESFNKGTFNYVGSGDRANSVSVSDAQNDRDGTKALKLSYDFTGQTGTSGAYVNAKTHLTISTPPKKIGMWVKGDGKGHWLRAQVKDASGKMIQLDFTTSVDWTDWRFVEAEVPANLSYPLKMDLPVRLMQTSDAAKTSGEILVDDIQSIYRD